MNAPVASKIFQELADGYRENIEDLIVEDRIDDALNTLQDLVSNLAPQLRDAVLILRRRYRQFCKDRLDQVAEPSEADVIVKTILGLLKEALKRPTIPSRYVLEDVVRAEEAHPSNHAALGVFAPPSAQPSPTVPSEPSVWAGGTAEATVDDRFRAYWSEYRRSKPFHEITAFDCEKIAKRYGSRFKLDELSFSLQVGQITGVVGRNASGKTTLLRIVQGEICPDGGNVSYPLLTLDKESWPHRKGQIAYISQFQTRWGGTVRRNLSYVAAVFGSRGQRNRDLVEWHIQRYGLADYQDAGWHELSGGFRMRYELVRALISKPSLLVLDEPLASLDVLARQEFLKNLRAIAYSTDRPVPVIVTSQHLYEIEAIADQMIVLDDGKCLFAGSSEDVASSSPVQLFEINTKVPKRALQERLGPQGLQIVETIADGFIVSCPKEKGAQSGMSSMVERIGTDSSGIRDITGSCRRFFINLNEGLRS